MLYNTLYYSFNHYKTVNTMSARDQVKHVASPRRFFRWRILRCDQNLVRHRAPFKCMRF